MAVVEEVSETRWGESEGEDGETSATGAGEGIVMGGFWGLSAICVGFAAGENSMLSCVNFQQRVSHIRSKDNNTP